jgi:hypothetical protein
MIRAKPGDVPDLHGFGWISWGRWMNTMNTTNTEENSWGYNTHTHTNRFFLVGPIHLLDRGCEKRPSGRSPAKRSTN